MSESISVGGLKPKACRPFDERSLSVMSVDDEISLAVKRGACEDRRSEGRRNAPALPGTEVRARRAAGRGVRWTVLIVIELARIWPPTIERPFDRRSIDLFIDSHLLPHLVDAPGLIRLSLNTIKLDPGDFGGSAEDQLGVPLLSMAVEGPSSTKRTAMP